MQSSSLWSGRSFIFASSLSYSIQVSKILIRSMYGVCNSLSSYADHRMIICLRFFCQDLGSANCLASLAYVL